MADEKIRVKIEGDYDDKAAKAAIKDAEKIEKLDPEIDITADGRQARREIDNVGQAAEEVDRLDPEIEVTADTSRAEAGLKDVESAGDKAAAALRTMAQRIDADLRGAAGAADALKAALGDAADRFDVDQVVTNLRKMGLTFDDIKGSADKLVVSLKEAEQLELARLNDGITTTDESMKRLRSSSDDTSTSMTRLRDSSDQSRSVLANMAGNAAQDLGALGGVAGTAGVAIGQLAEYATEGNINLSNLAKVGGPMIGLAAATLIATKAVEAYGTRTKKTEEETRQASEAVTDLTGSMTGLSEALAGAAISSGQFNDQLSAAVFESLADSEEEVGKVAKALFDLGLGFEDLGPVIRKIEDDNYDVTESFTGLQSILDDSGVPEYTDMLAEAIHQSEGFGDVSEKLYRIMIDAGYSHASATRESERLVVAYEDEIKAAEQLNDVQQNVDYEDIAARQLDIARGADEATDAFLREWEAAHPDATLTAEYEALLAHQEAFASSTEGINKALNENKSQQNAVAAAWSIVTTAMAHGELGAESARNAYTFLRHELQLSPAAMAEVAQQKFDEHMDDIAVAEEEAALALQEFNEATEDAARELDTAESRADAFAAAMERTRTTLRGVQTEQLISFVDNLHGVGDALNEAHDAGVAFTGIDIVPDTWDEVLAMPEELRPVVEAFGAMRESIATEMGEAFAAEGAPGVRTWAANTRTAVVDEIKAMNLGVTEEAALISQTLTELGLTDPQIEATITLAGQEQARQALGIFASEIEALPDDVEFRVKTLMANGEFIAAMALINVERVRQGQDPILIPGVFDSEDLDAAIAEERTGEPIGFGSDLTDAEDEVEDFETAKRQGEDVTFDADVSKAGRDVNTFKDAKRETTIDTNIATAIAAALLIAFITQPRTVTITADAEVAVANLLLNLTARDRTADINVALPNLNQAERALNELARTRTQTTVVRTVGSGGSGGATTGGIGPGTSMMPVAEPMSVTNVMVNAPRGTRPEDLIRAGDKYARRNGRAKATRR